MIGRVGSWAFLFAHVSKSAEVEEAEEEVEEVAGRHAWRLTVPAETAGLRVTVCGRCGVIHAERKATEGWVSTWRRWDARRADWETFDAAPRVCLPIRG